MELGRSVACYGSKFGHLILAFLWFLLFLRVALCSARRGPNRYAREKYRKF